MKSAHLSADIEHSTNRAISPRLSVLWGEWATGGTKEVPPVASDIDEYCETSIILGARFCSELDPGTHHPVIDRIEVVNSEEEANASSYLGSYG